MTHEHGKQVLEDLRGPARELRSLIPETYAGFGAMHKAALAEGELDGATKELIALAIGITQQCAGWRPGRVRRLRGLSPPGRSPVRPCGHRLVRPRRP